jgi:hypothetical protein
MDAKRSSYIPNKELVRLAAFQGSGVWAAAAPSVSGPTGRFALYAASDPKPLMKTPMK